MRSSETHLGGRIKRHWRSMKEIKGSRMTSHIWLVQPHRRWCYSLNWRTLKTWITNCYMYSSWHPLIIRKMQINGKLSYPSLPTCNIKPLGGGEGKGTAIYRQWKYELIKPPQGAIWQHLVKLKIPTPLGLRNPAMCPRDTLTHLPRRHIKASSLQHYLL